MSKIYQYESLDHGSRQFRLVVLLPSTDSTAQIKIKLEKAAFPTHDKYEALSYVWGDSSAPHTILVEQDVINVRENLHKALCHLRQPNKPRTLWIDALSIDQRNDKEKSHQVQQMRRIYSNASNVLVWLGTLDDDIASAISFIRLYPNISLEESQWPMPGLLKLYGNPWWSRVWVVQEVAVAREDPVFCCGNECVSWEAVLSILRQLCSIEWGRHFEDWLLGDPVALEAFCNIRSAAVFKQQYTLEFLLWMTANRKATKPHDYVYALFGLVYGETGQRLRPEINYSLPESHAFREAMVTVCEGRRDLHWLVFAANNQSKLHEQRKLPSWCIDFSSEDWNSLKSKNFWTMNSAEHCRQDRKLQGATAGREVAHSVRQSYSGTLNISGTRIGLVDFSRMATTRPVCTDEDSAKVRDDVRIVINSLLEDLLDYAIHSERALASRLGKDGSIMKIANGDIWKVAYFGLSFEKLIRSVHEDDDQSEFESRSDGYALLTRYACAPQSAWSALDAKWKSLLPEQLENFDLTAVLCYALIAGSTVGKCYFTTNTGYIGIADRKVEKGDLVCILFGCHVPVILRPLPDGSFTLVTSAYTHDVMDGEFLVDPSSVIEETFTLR